MNTTRWKQIVYSSQRLMVAIVALGLISCGPQLLKPTKTPEQVMLENYHSFVQSYVPLSLPGELKNQPLMVQRGVASYEANPQAMRDAALANARKNLKGDLKTNIKSIRERYGRSYHNVTTEPRASSKTRDTRGPVVSQTLDESLNEAIVEGLLLRSHVLTERDFTLIGKGYWIVLYVNEEDVRAVEAEAMADRSSISAEVRREEMRARLEAQRREEEQRLNSERNRFRIERRD